MIRQLVEGLKSVDGCLGVDLARTQSGKSMIFAWFKDAESARAWYNHPTHGRMLEMAGSDPAQGKPLEHVKDGTPVMVIASMTPAPAPQIEGLPIPISQISIELFTPLPGGASINGRLSPEGFPVEHHKAK
jgi:heme-degrading monooxygenase HmoA